jgi:hypothetical protein
MPDQNRVVFPGPDGRSFRTADGLIVRVPAAWVCTPPGDAGLTRRIKAAGPTWTVQEKNGRRTFSHGVWAPAGIVDQVRAALAAERATPEYARKREADAKRREREQADYVIEFRRAVVSYLAFSPRYAHLAARLADAVTAHATPVGSGTVARTERIPVGQRAEAAVIAWMRHQATGYDRMTIPRIKGKRRAVRRMLAERCKHLLSGYRTGMDVNPAACPLHRALAAA